MKEKVSVDLKGKLYGIGTGPGDPELLTIKAVRTLERCDVVAAPHSGSGEGTALAIVEEHIQGKELLTCHFSMDRDVEKRKAARLVAADQIIELLDDGKDVGFITLGDPTTYSTYMYVHDIVTAKGYSAEIVPGITSFGASAASLGIALCEGDKTLTIIPARHQETIDELLDHPGDKVIMKSGENLSYVLDKLKQRGLGSKTMISYRATMEGERLYTSIEEYEQAPQTGYFTLAIVKEDEQ